MITKIVKERIKRLHNDKEYTYDIFADIGNKEAVKKALRRMTDQIQFTSHGRFYKVNQKVGRTVIFDPNEHEFNYFWQSRNKTVQEVSSVICNYLKSLNPKEIEYLCKAFGYCRVKAELIAYHKDLYKQGYVDVKGLQIPLKGRWDRDALYLKKLRMLNDARSY